MTSNEPVEAKKLVPLILIGLSVGVISTIGEFMLGQLGWAFNAELDVPFAVIGSLAAAMFIAAGSASLASGWLVDLVSPRILLPIQAALAIAAFAGFGFARNEFELLLVCVAVGVCMTFGAPMTNRMIALYLVPRYYAVAVGWRSIGVQFSAVLVGLSFGGFTAVIEWRTIIWLWVGLGVVVTIWASWFLNHTPLLDHRSNGADAATPHSSDHDRHHPLVFWLLPISFSSIGAFTSLGAYLPSFAIESLGMGVGPAGMGMVVAATTSVFARFIWLRLMRKIHGMTLLAVSGILTAFGAVMLMISPGVGPWFFWVAVVLLGVVALGSFPVASVLLIQHANVKKIGLITAWSGLAGFAGLAAQPLFQSLLVAQSGLAAGWLVVSAGGLLTTTTVCLYSLLKPRLHAQSSLQQITTFR